MPASTIVSVAKLGTIPGRTTGYWNNMKIETMDTGLDVFLSVNAGGDVIIAAKGKVRLHLDNWPDPLLSGMAVNLTSGDYEIAGRLNGESARVCRRLHFVRGWSHAKTFTIFA
ncbi:MAG: hypothetical protein IT357_06510 [Gemmatimonadaceae bacterium]|nr:hypothetical protein [Gemmatimonadaceae bacterium]